jgi:hypothetical protein
VVLVIPFNPLLGHLAGLVQDAREDGGERRGDAAAESVVTSVGTRPVASIARH